VVPEKQGLKHYGEKDNSERLASLSSGSRKTRIETDEVNTAENIVPPV